MSRIIVFGATGYTGRLVTAELAAAGSAPLLAGRSAARLAELARPLGLDFAIADADQPASVRDLVERGDVLVSTVGPFHRYGRPALAAATAAGAHYVDSTGEAPFLRDVFTNWAEPAAAAGSALVPAFGYDFVPGNLAGALALDAATATGARGARLRIGYFLADQDGHAGPGVAGRGAASTGTKATALTTALLPHHGYRDGRLVPESAGRHVAAFQVAGRTLLAASIGGSEQFTLPRRAPHLLEVGVYLGWFGLLTPVMPVLAVGTGLARRVPGVEKVFRGLVGAVGGTALRRTGEGPDPAARARIRSLVVAEACDEGGRLVARVTLGGRNPYELTGALLAAAARRLADSRPPRAGALGPVDLFGVAGLRELAAQLGLQVIDESVPAG